MMMPTSCRCFLSSFQCIINCIILLSLYHFSTIVEAFSIQPCTIKQQQRHDCPRYQHERRRYPSTNVGISSSSSRLYYLIDPFQDNGTGDDDDDECSLNVSPSVLADCDTLPNCHTAHGILCPNVVSKMDHNTWGGQTNKAVKLFLDKYRHCGPMYCIEFLSDPDVLPHLTKAMRDTYHNK
jgi:hypothetical protein